MGTNFQRDQHKPQQARKSKDTKKNRQARPESNDVLSSNIQDG
jgi:hypothetical protein